VTFKKGHVVNSLIILAALAALMVGLAACGSSSSSSSSESTESSESGNEGSSETASSTSGNPEQATLEKEIKELEVRPTSINIKTPVKPVSGKNIVFLQCAIPDCAQTGESIEEAAGKLGWTVTKITIGTSPETIANAWNAALQKNPDAIINSGAFPQEFYKSQLAEAEKRGIPLMALAEAEQGKGSDPSSPWDLVVGSGEGFGAVTAEIAAKYVATQIDEGSVVAVTSPGIGVIESEIESFQENLPKFCPKCTVEVLEVPPAAIGTESGQRIAAYLQSHPDTKFGFLSVIDLAIGLDTAEKASGVSAVPMVSQSTDPAGLELIKHGEAGLEATTMYPASDGTWRLIDALARTWANQPVTEDEDATFPNWLINAGNLAPERPLPAVKDYKAQFEALWGLK
jgi:ribose transport system substrate-binding protein